MNLIAIIPGLGDEKSIRRLKIITKGWNKSHSQVIYFDPRWQTNESATAKIQRAENWVSDLAIKNKSITLIGISAGGPLAYVLSVKKSRSIHKLILISAKLRRPELIGINYQLRAPAIQQIVKICEQKQWENSLTKTISIQTFRPLIDLVVPLKDMTVKGARNRLIPAIGHAIGIGIAMIVLRFGRLT